MAALRAAESPSSSCFRRACIRDILLEGQFWPLAGPDRIQEFEALLLQESDHRYELAADLVIEFSDGQLMWREVDYDYGCSR